MRIVILIIGCMIGCASAQSTGDAPISDSDAEGVANTLSTCAGVWDAMSDVAASSGTPASAEQLHNMANGAEAAAMWVLASQHALAEKKATTYGSWSELTRPKRETGKTMLLAMAETQQGEEINRQIELCRSLLQNQEDILQVIRRDRVRGAQESPTP